MRKTVRCPTCRRRATREGNRFFPFCSERCRLIDLGKWAGEEYRISGQAVPAEETDEDKREE